MKREDSGKRYTINFKDLYERRRKQQEDEYNKTVRMLKLFEKKKEGERK